MKEDFRGSQDLFSFDGCSPSDSFTSSVSEQRLPPQNHDFNRYPSELKAPTSYDSVEGRYSPKSIPREGNFQSTLDWPLRDKIEDQTSSNSLESVNPSQLWNNMDPFAAEGTYVPSQFTHQGSDYGYMGLPAEPLPTNRDSGDQRSLITMEEVQQGDSAAHSKNIHSEGEQ